MTFFPKLSASLAVVGSQTGWYKWGLLRWAARSSDLKAANTNESSDKEDATAGLEDMGLDVSLTKEQEDFLLTLGQAESSSDSSLPRIESDSSFTSLLEGRDSDQTRNKDALASHANADAVSKILLDVLDLTPC